MKKIANFILIIIFTASGLYMTDFFSDKTIAVLFVSSLLLVFLMIVSKIRKLIVNIFTFIVMTMLFVAMIISALINGDLNLFVQALVIFLSYISLSVIYTNILKGCSLKKTYQILLWTQIPLVFSVFITGIDFPLTGVFYNPNALGVTATTVYVVLLAYLLSSAEESILLNKRLMTKKNFLVIITAIIMLLAVIGSKSRTSFVTVLAISAFALIVLLYKGIASKKYRATFKSLFIILILPLLLLFFYNFPPFKNYLYYNILYKFETKALADNVLSARNTVWKRTLEDASLFGNGRDYFVNEIGISAHNTFISFLGQFGWIVLILFVVFLMIAFRKGLSFSRINKGLYKYLPLFLVISFSLLSLAETMTHKVMMLALFVSVGSNSFVNFSKLKEDRKIVS